MEFQDFGCQEKEEARILLSYHEGLTEMAKNDNDLAIEKFKYVIDYFDNLTKDNLKNVSQNEIPLLGNKRQRPDDEIAKKVSNLDRIHFLSHKNIATIYFGVCIIK